MNHRLKPAVPRPPELLALLTTMKDHRRAQGRRHPLDLILILIIMGIMAGSKSERAICRFIKHNKKALIKALRIDRKEVPTRSVIQGVMQTVDFKELERIFHAWAIRFVPIKAKDFVSLDGKAIRGTVKNGQNAMQNFVSLVSVFASQQKQVLSATAIHTKKESEIPAVQNILALLHLHDVTFTLDALHCQEKTVNTIVETGNHYLIGAKDNQPKLHREMEKKCVGDTTGTYTKIEKNRGRQEKRTIMVYVNTLDPKLKQKWSSIDSLIRVDRVSIHNGETSQETAYFISDLPPETPAEYFYEGVRSHWRIESFHYVKDVTLGEDRSKVRTRNAPQNYSLNKFC